jgi:hypothetical protein
MFTRFTTSMRLRPALILLILLLLTGSSSKARSQALDLVVFLPFAGNRDAELVLYPTGDSEIREFTPLNNYDNELELRVGATSRENAQRALIQFNLASLPSNAEIQQASFFIYYHNWVDHYLRVHTVSIYRITSPWISSEVNWYNQPETGELTGSIDLPADLAHWGYYGIDVTQLASGWQAGSIENHGLMLRTAEIDGDWFYRTFWSREGEHPPKLIISYK